MSADAPAGPFAAPLRVHGLEVSYFTGKLEAYLRYKEIPYARVRAVPARIRRHTGVFQVPAVELPDGRWLCDTTPTIAWLETRVPEPPVLPADPWAAFASRLLEDHGDEWLWRPAMHYRWSHPGDAALLSRRIVEEVAGPSRWLGPARRLAIRTRQRLVFVRDDGVRAETREHVEATYRDTLARLGAVLADRPFLLGGAPSLADFGFFGSMFRHFGTDPTPASRMRETAPGVYAWVARVWNARASRTRGALEPRAADAWGPLLDAVGATHLEHLDANARAWQAGRRRFDVVIEGVRYRRLRTSRYRVACLEALRGHFEALPEPARGEVRRRLEAHGCWEPLFRTPGLDSGLPLDDPFARGHSMTGVGPALRRLIG